MATTTRRTRFVCVSDTHNASPDNGAFKLPKGDVLIHAGDLTKQGTMAELRKTLEWLDKADFEVKLVVAGNHDITLDRDFYAEHGLYFHNQEPQDAQACIDVIGEFKSLTYLNHSAKTIRLCKDGGLQTVFNVFGSPYSPRHGLWAFGYPSEDAPSLWSQIPLDTDLVITHTPPKYHCDETGTGSASGCEGLRQALWRIRPSLAVCGHIHEARGAQRVLWDLHAPHIKYKEQATEYWEDPGQDNKKQSLLDLTSKGGRPIRNDGSWEHSYQDHPRQNSNTLIPVEKSTVLSDKQKASTNHGQGGDPESGQSDHEALVDRMGRQETCVVNAAVMASSWPYKTRLGRKYNKPIVIDLDLAVSPVI